MLVLRDEQAARDRRNKTGRETVSTERWVNSPLMGRIEEVARVHTFVTPRFSIAGILCPGAWGDGKETLRWNVHSRE